MRGRLDGSARSETSIAAAAAARVARAALSTFTCTVRVCIESALACVLVVGHRAFREIAALIRLDDHTSARCREREEYGHEELHDGHGAVKVTVLESASPSAFIAT